MLKKITLFTLPIALLGSMLLFTSDKQSDYEAFVNDYLETGPVQPTGGHAPDRPDLALKQNFLMTMHPQKKRPTPEVLPSLITQFSGPGTLGVPGDADNAWVERGPSNIGGRTRGLLWDPEKANKVWAGGVTGGLWFNTDITNADQPWQKVDDFWDNLSITALAADPTNANTRYAATGEGLGGPTTRGLGIWQSTDAGATWNQLTATSEYYFVDDIVVRNESGTGVLYAGVKQDYFQGEWHGHNGLYRSSDGGATFTQVAPAVGNSVYAVADLEVGADGRIWAGTRNNSSGEGGGTILYSDDGTNWTVAFQNTSLDRVEIAVAPSNQNAVYAIMEVNWVVEAMYFSSDKGANWVSITEPADADDGIPNEDFTRGQAGYDLIAQVDPASDSTVFVGGIDLFKSTDAGQTWNQISHWYGGFGFPNVHADQHGLLFRPGSSSDLLISNDGGVYLTTTANAAQPEFINRNNNYNVTQFYACAIHPTAGKSFFLAGSQDNGTQRFDGDGLIATTEAFGGDGAYCFIDQDDPKVQIVSYVHNSYHLSTDEGATFNKTIHEDETTGLFINPADYDDNLNILYAASSKTSIARYTSLTSDSPVRTELDIDMGAQASHFRVSQHTQSSSTVFIGTSAGRVFKMEKANDTPSITELTGDLPQGWVSSIDVGNSEDTLLVTISNYGVNSVWLSLDGGGTWSSKEGNLPDLPVRWGLLNPANAEEVLLATELGVWSSTNFLSSSPTWTKTINGMANVRVDMLQIRSSDNEVIAATHGRGLFSSSAWKDGASVPDLSNLSFAVPDGWDDALITSRTPISETDPTSTPISIADSIYITYTLQNNGSLALESPVEVELLVNGASVEKEEILSSGSLEVNASLLLKWKLGPLSEGLHVIKIVADSKEAVDEQVESDNAQSKTIYVQASCSSETITQASGNINDGSGQDIYLNDLNCQWLIQPDNADSIILEFADFSLEQDVDILTVRYGANESVLTGSNLPAAIRYEGEEISLDFKTNASTGTDGWNIQFTSVDVPDPDAPQNLFVEALAPRVALITWDDASDNEEKFIIERATGSSDTFEEVGEAGADAVTYTDSTLTEDTEYTYRVVAANRFDKSSSEDFMVTTPLGLEPGSRISIYPNPVNRELTIETKAETDYRIMAISGHTLIEGQLTPGNRNINLESLRSGYYLIQLKSSGKVEVHRLLKK